jgi:hypothetical protein
MMALRALPTVNALLLLLLLHGKQGEGANLPREVAFFFFAPSIRGARAQKTFLVNRPVVFYRNNAPKRGVEMSRRRRKKEREILRAVLVRVGMRKRVQANEAKSKRRRAKNVVYC